MTQTAPTDTSAPTPEASTEAAPPDVPLSFKLPSLADQVRAQLAKDKAEARAKGGTTPARDESGRFKAAEQEEAQAAREDGDARRHRSQSKAKAFDDARAEEIEEREAAGEAAEPPEDASEAVHSSEQAEKPKPKGEPKAARWRVKLKAGERRLEQMQAQILDQSRQIAEQQRQIEARAKEVEARAARLAELEALESGLASDPLSLLYERQIDPETLTLRHYERVKAGTAGKAERAAVAAMPPEVKKALDELAEVKKKLAEAEETKKAEAKAAEVERARAHFLSQVTETDYPDLDAYRDLRGDEDVVLSAFGPDGTAHWLEARLGRMPTHAEVLRQLNEDAGKWLAQRKVAQRFADRKTADSGRETEPRAAAKPEGAKPISKTLSNRQASNGSPPAPPDFGSRTDSTKYLVDALRTRPQRLDAWR